MMSLSQSAIIILQDAALRCIADGAIAADKKLARIEDAITSRLNAAEIKDGKEEVARALREILEVIRAK